MGVCLGHEIIGEAFGGNVIHANNIMHGKTSLVYHSSSGLFDSMPLPATVARYHSLILERESIPDCFDITAYTASENGAMYEVMGISHRTLPIHGVQFHPESILTIGGHKIFANFLGINIDDCQFSLTQ